MVCLCLCAAHVGSGGLGGRLGNGGGGRTAGLIGFVRGDGTGGGTTGFLKSETEKKKKKHKKHWF